MVKSRTLGLLCSAALVAIAGCSPAPQPQPVAVQPQPATARPYASIAECQSDANNPNPQLCQASFNASVAALPHYSGLTACEMQYGVGACQSHGDWFGPALAGFMLGSMMSGGGYHYYSPLYVNHGYVYSNGRSLGYAPTRTYYHGSYVYGTPRNTVVVVHNYAPTPAATVTRGGFGGNQATNSMNAARPAANVATHTVVATSRPAYTSSISTTTTRGGFGGSSGGSSGGFHSSGGGSGGFG